MRGIWPPGLQGTKASRHTHAGTTYLGYKANYSLVLNLEDKCQEGKKGNRAGDFLDFPIFFFIPMAIVYFQFMAKGERLKIRTI